MTRETIAAAKREAEEFVRRARAVLDDTTGYYHDTSVVARGALRRQSMELTRALAEMRRA